MGTEAYIILNTAYTIFIALLPGKSRVSWALNTCRTLRRTRGTSLLGVCGRLSFPNRQSGVVQAPRDTAGADIRAWSYSIVSAARE